MLLGDKELGIIFIILTIACMCAAQYLDREEGTTPEIAYHKKRTKGKYNEEHEDHHCDSSQPMLTKYESMGSCSVLGEANSPGDNTSNSVRRVRAPYKETDEFIKITRGVSENFYHRQD